MSPTEHIHELQRGARWTDSGRDIEIVGIEPRDGELIYVARSGSEFFNMTMAEAIRSMTAAAWINEPMYLERADDDILLSKLDKTTYKEVLRREADLLEAMTGYRRAFHDPAEKPRAKYDPEHVKLTDRMKSRAKESGVALSTFYEWAGRWKKRGRAGLVHQNTKAHTNPLAKFDEHTIETAKAHLIKDRVKSTKTQLHLQAGLRLALERAGCGMFRTHDLATLIRELTRGQSMTGDASTRQTKLNRPAGGNSWERITDYCEVMEMDSTPADFFCWSPGEQKEIPVWLVGTTCPATKTNSVLVTPNPPSGRAAAMALFRRVVPPEIVDVDRPWVLAPSVPRVLAVAEDFLSPDERFRITPEGIPGELHLDHGRESENQAFLELGACLGIDIVFSQPRSPSQKPHIEVVNAKIANWAQLFPGHKGNAVKNRGKNPEGDPMLLTVEEAQRLADVLCYLDMFTPHTGLRHPQTNLIYTPMEAYITSITQGAPLRICPDVNLIMRFLPTVRAVVNGGTTTVDNVVYTCEEIKTLESMSAGDKNVASIPLTFHYDPYDISRLFWHEPGTGRWHTLRAINADGTTLPPFSDYSYAQMLKLAGRKRLSKDERIDIRTHLMEYVEALQKTKKGRKELAREFARWVAAVPNPDQSAHRTVDAYEQSWVAPAAPADAIPITRDTLTDHDDNEAIYRTDDEAEYLSDDEIDNYLPAEGLG